MASESTMKNNVKLIIIDSCEAVTYLYYINKSLLLAPLLALVLLLYRKHRLLVHDQCILLDSPDGKSFMHQGLHFLLLPLLPHEAQIIDASVRQKLVGLLRKFSFHEFSFA